MRTPPRWCRLRSIQAFKLPLYVCYYLLCELNMTYSSFISLRTMNLTPLYYCKPNGSGLWTIDLFVWVSRLSQFFHSWLQSFSCPMTMHMWMLTHQLTILTISYAFSCFKQKEEWILGESGILGTTFIVSCSRRKEWCWFLYWSFPLHYVLFQKYQCQIIPLLLYFHIHNM